jgi:hypothetical protein
MNIYDVDDEIDILREENAKLKKIVDQYRARDKARKANFLKHKRDMEEKYGLLKVDNYMKDLKNASAMVKSLEELD